MNLKTAISAGAQNAVGVSMRLYRASPLYPRLGPTLGKLLGPSQAIRLRPSSGKLMELASSWTCAR